MVLTRSLTAVFRNVSRGMFRTQLQPGKRTFILGQARLSNKNDTQVDGYSKFALVVDGKYKSMAEVPDILPYRTVCKARDKLRIKASILSAVLLLILAIFLIKRYQRLKREADFERYEEGDR